MATKLIFTVVAILFLTDHTKAGGGDGSSGEVGRVPAMVKSDTLLEMACKYSEQVSFVLLVPRWGLGFDSIRKKEIYR